VFLVGIALSVFGQDVYNNRYTRYIKTLLLMQGTAQIDFNTAASGESINSSTADQLDIDATTEVEIGATTIDLNGRTVFNTTVADTNAFTGTATADTVVVTGATTSSVFVVSGMYLGGVDQQDVLQWDTRADTLIVYRLASGESAGKYSWFWLK